MANLATADHAAQGSSARGRSPYMVQNTIDLAAAIVLKGADFAANDTMEVLNVPAGTVILSAGIEIITQADGTLTLDMGFTGASPAAIDLYVDGLDCVGGAVGTYGVTPGTEAAQVQVPLFWCWLQSNRCKTKTTGPSRHSMHAPSERPADRLAGAGGAALCNVNSDVPRDSSCKHLRANPARAVLHSHH